MIFYILHISAVSVLSLLEYENCIVGVYDNVLFFRSNTQWAMIANAYLALQKKKVLVCSTANFHSSNAVTTADFLQST